MNTAEKFHAPFQPARQEFVLPPKPEHAIWMRIKAAMSASWRLVGSASGARVDETVAEPCRLPVAVGKISTISSVGIVALSKRDSERMVSPSNRVSRAVASVNTRRPGLQNRWKSSDRVAGL